MQYDRFDTSVICHSVRANKAKSVNSSKNDFRIRGASNDHVSNEVIAKTEVDHSNTSPSFTSLDNHMDSKLNGSAQSASHSGTVPFYNPYEDHSSMTVMEPRALDSFNNFDGCHTDT
ncbi:hypothetical protein OSTOST_10509, partial [Ostertagia ostertagi]